MRKSTMYYKWIISHLDSLIEKLEEYGNSNPHIQQQDPFIDCLNFVEEVKDEIVLAKTNNTLYTDTAKKNQLYSTLRSFNSTYPNFDGVLLNKLRLWIQISISIELLIDSTTFGSNIPVDDYKSYILSENDQLPMFIDQFSNDNGGMFTIPISRLTDLEQYLNDKLVDDHLLTLYIILKELNSEDHWSTGIIAILKVNNTGNNSLQKIKSIVQLRILSKGIPIKQIPKNSIVPSLPLKQTYLHSKSYDQFSEIIEIINELNNQEFLLDKYFKVYHIIENLMYRYRVNKLMLSKNNNLSVRDLQLISENFLKGEESVLKEFINECFKIVYDESQNPKVTYKQHAKILWNNLANTPDDIDRINDILIRIRLTNKNSDVYSHDSISNNFDGNIIGKLIYKVRNSVVHNKDSEHHLYHTNLPHGVENLISTFLIPLLTKLVYHLLINYNKLIWYDKKTMKLYR